MKGRVDGGRMSMVWSPSLLPSRISFVGVDDADDEGGGWGGEGVFVGRGSRFSGRLQRPQMT